MLWVLLFSCWPQSSTLSLMLRLWTTSTNGQRQDKSTIFSSRKCLDSPISGRISPRKPLSTWWPQEEIPLWSLPCGNTFSVVPGLHKNSLTVTLTNLWFAECSLSVQPLSSPFLLRTPGEPTTLIRHGHLSWEETIPQQLRLCSEFHLKRDQDTYWKEVSHLLSTNSCSGQLMWTSTFSWKISSSCSGFTMILVTTLWKLYSWVRPSELPLSLLTQHTWQEKWLICGQRREEVSAPGTIVTDNASSGWLKTWNFTTTTILGACSPGRRDTEFNTSSDSGWPIVLVWCPTVMRPITP